ncbi:MAG: 4'-phosphopantetheinyl transferase superfamily protein [Thermodesulfobacteriota bacterium]
MHESDRPGVEYGPVRQVRIAGSGPTVWYGSAGLGARPRSARGKHSVKRLLLTHLWDQCRHPGDSADTGLFPLAHEFLGADHLGRPIISAEVPGGLAVSFSACGDDLWAALSLGSDPVGIDAADPREFAGPYPFARVFGAEEWGAALNLVSGDSLEAAALLWAAKEAATKALGVGMHFTEPLYVGVEVDASQTSGNLLRVCYHGHTGGNTSIDTSSNRGGTRAATEVPVAWERVAGCYVGVARYAKRFSEP